MTWLIVSQPQGKALLWLCNDYGQFNGLENCGKTTIISEKTSYFPSLSLTATSILDLHSHSLQLHLLQVLMGLKGNFEKINMEYCCVIISVWFVLLAVIWVGDVWEWKENRGDVFGFCGLVSFRS